MQNNVDFDGVVGQFAQLLLFEVSVLTKGPAEEAHAKWMRDWSIS